MKMDCRNSPGPPTGDVRFSSESARADITCKAVEKVLDSLAEQYGIADKWRARKATLQKGDAYDSKQEANPNKTDALQRTSPMAPRNQPSRQAFGSEVYLDSRLRKRLRINSAFRLAAPGIAAIAFLGCAAVSWHKASIAFCLTRAALAGLAALVLMRLVGIAAANHWGNRG